MKYLFTSTVIFLFLGHSSQADSREFTHFKMAKSASASPSSSIVNVLTELETEFKGKSQSIGRTEVERITNSRDTVDGVINFSGFSWYRPMSNFEILARREISPELFSNKWIVRDTLTIYIDAATLLTSLRNEGIIIISDKALSFFVGINFQRKYHYYHYASSYSEGLRSDYSKLFLSFTKLNPKELFKLKGSEIIKREDIITVKASGEAHLPLTAGLSIGASASGEVTCRNEFSYQHIETDDKSTNNEEARLSLEQSVKKETAAELSLKLDFFGILRETLLKYELSYDFMKTNKTYLKFNQADQKKILEDKNSLTQLTDYIKGDIDILNLKEYLISTETREKENLSSRFGFLIYGKLRNKATEQVRIIKDGVEKIFYKLNSESVTYVQSLISKLWSRTFYHIFKWESYVAHKAEKRKSIHIQYEQRNNIFNRTDSEQSLSVTLTQSMYLNKVSKKKHRKNAIKHIELLSNLEESLFDRINNKQIKGPMRISAKLELRTMALYYFNHLDPSSAYSTFFDICRVSKESYEDLLNKSKRKSLLRGKLNRSLRCSKKLIRKYDQYMEDYISNQNINIKELKNLLGSIFKKVESYQELVPLFGEGNTFIHGSFSAMTDSNFPYQAYFKTGQFQEFGVIDRFKNK